MRTILAIVVLVPVSTALGDNGGPAQQGGFELRNNERLIVGRWEEKDALTLEFTKNGKLHYLDDDQVVVFRGTYRFLSANQIEITLEIRGKKEHPIPFAIK